MRRVTLGARREGYPPVQAAILDAVYLAVDTLEEGTLTEEGRRTCLTFLQLVGKGHGIPLVAQAKSRVQIALPRLVPLPAFDLAVDVIAGLFCLHTCLPC